MDTMIDSLLIKARPSLRLVRGLERFTMRGLSQIVARLRAGGSVEEFEEAMVAHLHEAHARGVVLGRQWAGDDAPRERDDDVFADIQMEREIEYLSRFVADIEAGRYTGEDGAYTSGLDARVNLYGHKVGGTVSEAFALASADGERFVWTMLADEHCQDCPRIAAGGPYTAETLPTFPRAGATECKTNCKCVLVRQSDGLPSPPPFGY